MQIKIYRRYAFNYIAKVRKLLGNIYSAGCHKLKLVYTLFTDTFFIFVFDSYCRLFSLSLCSPSDVIYS